MWPSIIPSWNGFIASIQAPCEFKTESVELLFQKILFFFILAQVGKRTGRRFGSLTAVLSHTTQKMLAV